MTGLYFMNNLVSDPHIQIGAQNIHFEQGGAFTGETSAEMAVDCGANYVLVGHSERRWHFDEDDTAINKKIKAALSAGLNVILCIGETNEEYEAGQTKNVLATQIDGAIRGLPKTNRLIIAYEPVWAVGSGNTAAVEEIVSAVSDIKKMAPSIPLLYGGSVNEQNAAEILAIGGIDGVLVGAACLNPKKFACICGLK
jgi:triosephosphate isomerase